MDDDFNTAMVIGEIFTWMRLWNKALDDGTVSLKDVAAFLKILEAVHTVLGLFGSPAQLMLDGFKNKALAKAAVSEDEIKNLLTERKQARQNKNFKRADEIRDTLLSNNIQIKDHPDGTTSWSIS